MQEFYDRGCHVTDVRVTVTTPNTSYISSPLRKVIDLDAEPIYVPELKPQLTREAAHYLIKEMAFEFLRKSDTDQPHLRSNVEQLVAMVIK